MFLVIDERKAMEAALGNCKDYSLKQYLLFADKLQKKAKVSHTLISYHYKLLSLSFQAFLDYFLIFIVDYYLTCAKFVNAHHLKKEGLC